MQALEPFNVDRGTMGQFGPLNMGTVDLQTAQSKVEPQFRRLFALDLLEEPGAGETPVFFSGGQRDPQHL